MSDSLESILNDCIECRLCVEECPFLLKYNWIPKDIAKDLLRGIDENKRYVMECFLCDLCRAVCPKNLDFPSVIVHARQSFSKYISGEIYYRLFLPDDQLFFPKAYKTYKKIIYDFPKDGSFKYIFFPGCSMSSYSPEAVKEVYRRLAKELCSVGFIDTCCGKPLADVGLTERASKWIMNLNARFIERECGNIVTACPMCYYYLKSSLPKSYKILTVYEVLGESLSEKLKRINLKVTIHDSCPDRFNGIFARQVRSLLRGCEVLEMRHSREKSLCCGAGGIASIADPSLALKISSVSAEEFSLTGADLMVVYCYTCAQVFWNTQPKIRTKHILDLMLGTRDLSEDIKSGEVNNLVAKILMEQI
ncbi:MAG: (Fe-S)-binding protein [Candidatus Bathyarchaeia archaeon]